MRFASARASTTTSHEPGRLGSTLWIRGRLVTCRNDEFASETSDAVLTILLKVTERDCYYWWVECGSCEAGWQVPFYAESIGTRR